MPGVRLLKAIGLQTGEQIQKPRRPQLLCGPGPRRHPRAIAIFQQVGPDDERRGVEADAVQVHPEKEGDLVAALHFQTLGLADVLAVGIHPGQRRRALRLQECTGTFGSPGKHPASQRRTMAIPFLLGLPETSVNLDHFSAAAVFRGLFDKYHRGIVEESTDYVDFRSEANLSQREVHVTQKRGRGENIHRKLSFEGALLDAQKRRHACQRLQVHPATLSICQQDLKLQSAPIWGEHVTSCVSPQMWLTTLRIE